MRSMRTSGAVLAVGFLVALIAVMAISSPAQAVPTLQLDIRGGHYDPASQTIIAGNDPFTLYAYLTVDAHTPLQSQLGQTYFISAAVVPRTGPAGADLGMFAFGGTPIRVTRDMTYGVPPIEADGSAAADQHDLAPHGIFETYFREFSFHFDPSQQSVQYDTAVDTGIGPQAVPPGFPSGRTMYWVAFQVDTRGLADGYAVHFDLYNEFLNPPFQPAGDIDAAKFAPFDHDAQSPPHHHVPEVETLLLLGSGLLVAGLGLSRRGPRR